MYSLYLFEYLARSWSRFDSAGRSLVDDTTECEWVVTLTGFFVEASEESVFDDVDFDTFGLGSSSSLSEDEVNSIERRLL